MHIEIFQTSNGQWYWHKRNVGKVTCDSEEFPTKQHAIRAAKADVTQTIKPYRKRLQSSPVKFTEALDKVTDCYVLKWT